MFETCFLFNYWLLTSTELSNWVFPETCYRDMEYPALTHTNNVIASPPAMDTPDTLLLLHDRLANQILSFLPETIVIRYDLSSLPPTRFLLLMLAWFNILAIIIIVLRQKFLVSKPVQIFHAHKTIPIKRRSGMSCSLPTGWAAFCETKGGWEEGITLAR